MLARGAAGRDRGGDRRARHGATCSVSPSRRCGRSRRCSPAVVAGRTGATSTCRCCAAAARCRSSPRPCATRASRPASRPSRPSAPRGRGFDFTELVMPDVAGPEGLRSYRDPIARGRRLRVRRRSVAVLGADDRVPPGARPRRRGSPSRTVPRRPRSGTGSTTRRSATTAGRRGRHDRALRHHAQLRRPEGRPRRRRRGSRRASTTRSTSSDPLPPGGCSPTTRPVMPAMATPASTAPSGTRRAPTSSPTPPR